MPAFELRLPAMTMGVDEAWTNDLVGAINSFSFLRWDNLTRNSYYFAVFHKNVGLSGDDMVLCVVNQSKTAFEKDVSGSHCNSCSICLAVAPPNLVNVNAGLLHNRVSMSVFMLDVGLIYLSRHLMISSYARVRAEVIFVVHNPSFRFYQDMSRSRHGFTWG
jgi:hypothetical protein